MPFLGQACGLTQEMGTLQNIKVLGKTMRTISKFISAGLISIIASSTAVHAKHDPSQFTKTFTWATAADARSMDPHGLYEVVTVNINENVHEPLNRRNPELILEPCLATKWEQVKPTVWRYTLREGVTFHDGKPFTAKDVVFSYKRARSENSDFKGVIGSIKDVVEINPTTIEITTHDVDPILPRKTTDILIMSEAWCKEHNCETPADANAKGENYATRNANGTGPFKLVSRAPDVATKFAVNLDWWDKAEHNLKEATFRPIQAPTTRTSSLLSGDIDFTYPISIQDIPRVKGTPDFKVLEGNELLVLNLFMNLNSDTLHQAPKTKNPFKDVRVRKAINLAIDKDAICKTIMRGYGRPTVLLYGEGINGYDKSIDTPHRHNVEEGKKLLAEAGYPNGFEVSLNGPNDRYINDEHICVALAGMLGKIGIKVTVQTETKSNYFKKLLAKNCECAKGTCSKLDLKVMGWFPGTYDALDSLENLAATFIPERQGAYNLGGYSNPAYDALIVKIGREKDGPNRVKLINQASEILKEEVPIIPLHQQKAAWAMKKGINTKFRADNFVCLRNIKVES